MFMAIINKDLNLSLLRLSFIFFFLLLSTSFLFSEDFSSKQEYVYLLEKDYLSLKSNFEKYLLPFPDIDFNFVSLDDYLRIINDYSNLPKLSIKNISFSEHSLSDVNLSDYDVDYNFGEVIKKEILLEINDQNFIEEYIFLEITVFNKSKIIDVIDKSYILKSDGEVNTIFIDKKEYLQYDKNQSFLLSSEALDYGFKPLLIYKKEINPTKVIEPEKDNSFFMFLIVVFCLFICY